MSEPINSLHEIEAEETSQWNRWLVIFLRLMACLEMAKGMYHWSQVLGIGDGPGSSFEARAVPWQAATVYFAVIDLVAAVGLWLAAAWGGVVWLTAAISMAAVELFFPQVFGGRMWVVYSEFGLMFLYFALAIMASRVRAE